MDCRKSEEESEPGFPDLQVIEIVGLHLGNHEGVEQREKGSWEQVGGEQERAVAGDQEGEDEKALRLEEDDCYSEGKLTNQPCCRRCKE